MTFKPQFWHSGEWRYIGLSQLSYQNNIWVNICAFLVANSPEMCKKCGFGPPEQCYHWGNRIFVTQAWNIDRKSSLCNQSAICPSVTEKKSMFCGIFEAKIVYLCGGAYLLCVKKLLPLVTFKPQFWHSGEWRYIGFCGNRRQLHSSQWRIHWHFGLGRKAWPSPYSVTQACNVFLYYHSSSQFYIITSNAFLT